MTIVEKLVTPTPHRRWTQRQQHIQLLESVGRYTRFVILSKRFFAGLSLLMIILIIIIPALNADKEGLRIAFTTIGEQQEALPIMKNPTFQGVDDYNQPYMITAEEAIQQDADVIILNDLQADLFTKDKAWLNITSKTGTLHRTNKTLHLSGEVSLFHDEGYEFKTESVLIQIQSNTAAGDQKISGTGPLGSLSSDAFLWDNEARKMEFSGNVLLTIRPNKQ